jgi:peroxiredoxin
MEEGLNMEFHTRKRLVPFAALLALAASLPALSPAPRKSPEFTILGPSGKQTLLTSLKGKVVLMEILWTNCPHCQRASRTIAKLHQELGARGFRPIGVAIDNAVTDRMLTDFVKEFGVTYPMGRSTVAAVDSYLGRSPTERLMLPQIVVIDREGVIRAQSGAMGDPKLEDENYLRGLLENLLR